MYSLSNRFSTRASLIRAQSHTMGMLRAFCYLTVLIGVSTFFLLHAAHAQATRAVEQFGETLLKEIGPMPPGLTEALVINGQRFFVSTVTTEKPLSEVVEELDEHCRDSASPVIKALEHLPAQVGDVTLNERERDPVNWGINRYETADHKAAQVACLAHRKDTAGLAGLVENIGRFVQSGDVSELGSPRYFLAREVGAGKSHVLSIWTSGPFNLPGMFPESGDAPGTDPQFAPRPQDSTRIFSTVVPQRHYRLGIYRSPRAQAQILSEYDKHFSIQGWTERAVSDDNMLRPLSRAFTKGDAAVFVTLDAPDELLIPVTIVEMGGKGYVEAFSSNPRSVKVMQRP